MLSSLKIHYVLTIIAMVMAGMSTLYESQPMTFAAVGIISALIVLCDINIAFYTVLSTVFMWDAVRVNGVLMGFFFSFLYICKAFMSKRNNLEKNTLSLLVFFLIIFLINDILRCTFSQVTNDLMRLLLLFACLKSVKIESYNHRYAVFLLITALVITQVFALLVTGIESMLDSNVGYYRIGEAEDDSMNTFGGAMEFPIYAIIITTTLLPFLTGKYLGKIQKVGMSLIVVATVIMAMFAASRVYLLGLAVMVIVLLLSYANKGRLLLIFAVLAMVVMVAVNTDIVQLAIMRYTLRQENLSGDLSNGRQAIWTSILEFLTYNPHRLLLGCGYRGYQMIGFENRLPFSGTAHNIVLDGLMAYGLFGLSVMVLALRNVQRHLKRVWKTKATMLSLMPFLCWFAMCMTNSAFLLYKTFVLIPFFLLHAYTIKQLMIKDNEKNTKGNSLLLVKQ